MSMLSLMSRLVGRRVPDSAQHSRFLDAGADAAEHAASSAGRRNDPTKELRRELLRVALRSTLTRNGIPVNWIAAEALSVGARNNAPGLHVRFVVRHWDPRIALHAPALQHDFSRRLLAFDPMAATWLRGYSWQYDLPDPSVCPPLPDRGSWTAEPSPPPIKPYKRAEATGSDGPIISGPVVIGALQARGSRRDSARPIVVHGVPPARGNAHADHAMTEPSPLGRGP